MNNNTISGNRAVDAGGGVSCRWNSFAGIANSILWGNTALSGPEISLRDGSTLVACYCDVAGGADRAQVEGGCWLDLDIGGIDVDPCFAGGGHWEDPCSTPGDPNDDSWAAGDYHLKSQGGRWEANEGGWVIDEVTSLCIDAGSPATPIAFEPFPNGGIVNMGAYGGTAEASKSYFDKPPCQMIVAGDLNGDCAIDFRDVYIMTLHWLESR